MNLTQSPSSVSEKTASSYKYMEERTTAVQIEIIFLKWKRDSTSLRHDTDEMRTIC